MSLRVNIGFSDKESVTIRDEDAGVEIEVHVKGRKDVRIRMQPHEADRLWQAIRLCADQAEQDRSDWTTHL